MPGCRQLPGSARLILVFPALPGREDQDLALDAAARFGSLIALRGLWPLAVYRLAPLALPLL